MREYGIDGALAGLPAIGHLGPAHARFCPEWDEEPDAPSVRDEPVVLLCTRDDRPALGCVVAQGGEQRGFRHLPFRCPGQGRELFRHATAHSDCASLVEEDCANLAGSLDR